MHTLLGLTSLLLVLLVSGLLLIGGQVFYDWAHRRMLQLMVLSLPLLSLAMALLALHHFSGRTCFVGAPPWDYTIGRVVPLLMTGGTLLAVLIGLARLWLVSRTLGRRGQPADPALQARVEALGQYFKLAPPQLRTILSDQPLALTYGLRRPTILLSTWMLQRLDERELEAVLAHELGHIARRDYLVLWVAGLLRDAFCYLPTTWAAYTQLRREKEPASDELAVQATGRPLALASALVKIWGQHLDVSLAPAQTIAERGASIEERICWLMERPRNAIPQVSSQRLPMATALFGLLALLVLQAAAVTVFLAPMGCGPAAFL